MTYRFPETDFCCFCECISGRLPWFPIVEEANAVAFLNPRQRASGAALVSPRRHVHTFSDLTVTEARAVLGLTLTISGRLQSALAPDGLHVFCNSGEVAGQSEPHAHFQVIPRYADRPYSFVSSRMIDVTPSNELAALSRKLTKSGWRPPKSLPVARDMLRSECRVCRDINDANCVVLEWARGFVAIVPERGRTHGSAVIAARRCMSGPDGLTPDEQVELVDLIQSTAKAIERAYEPDGLNMWWDLGTIAGQTDPHFCVDLVPRFDNVPYKYMSMLDLPVMPNLTRERIAYELRSGQSSSRQSHR